MTTDKKDKKQTAIRILLYFGISFILLFSLRGLFMMPEMIRRLPDGYMYSIMIPIARLLPALTVLIVRLISKEGFSQHMLSIKVKGGKGKYYILAWFLPSVLALAGAGIYFAVFSDQFDWNISYYMDNVSKTGNSFTLEALRSSVISQTITSVILGPAMKCISGFGEEWGWRGYLLPKLLKVMPMFPAIIVNGLIWGLWYAPLVAAGLNYNTNYSGYPVTGILLMTLFCVVLGIFLSFLTIRTVSCIPAIIACGAVNSVGAAAVKFTSDGGRLLLGPAITGVIGMIPLIITAVIVSALLVRDNTCVNELTCDTIVEASSDGEKND